MGLNKANGQMYPWVTHTHSHLAGACPHACSYCYLRDMGKRFPKLQERYSGPLRLIEKEFAVKYGSGKTIFMENCNDLFAGEVPQEFINRVVHHAWAWPPKNTYVWQTKNPKRYATMETLFPDNGLFGVTIETNRDIAPAISKAPQPRERAAAMMDFKARKFVTIEPIMDFDPGVMATWIRLIKPEFVNIGADSKRSGLQEPPAWKVKELLGLLEGDGIEVREKHNLDRLLER